jgi:hypothetical protein
MKSTEAIKRSPVLQALQLTALFVERCHSATETASHILSESMALAEFRFRQLGRHSYGPGDCDKIPLCKILYIVRETELLAGKKADEDSQ